MMNLNTMKEHIDFLVDRGFGENNVLITLSDNSIGGRASVGIDHISNGFDWESGQIRIEPSKKIISYENNRDNVILPRKRIYEQNGRKYAILSCKKCENKLRKDDIFCSRCGQKCKDTKKNY